MFPSRCCFSLNLGPLLRQIIRKSIEIIYICIFAPQTIVDMFSRATVVIIVVWPFIAADLVINI